MKFENKFSNLDLILLNLMWAYYNLTFSRIKQIYLATLYISCFKIFKNVLNLKYRVYIYMYPYLYGLVFICRCNAQSALLNHRRAVPRPQHGIGIRFRILIVLSRIAIFANVCTTLLRTLVQYIEFIIILLMGGLKAQ